MAIPNQMTLTKKQSARVSSMFKKGVCNARVIAKTIGVPRRQVMLYLEMTFGISYSNGSYN